MCKRSTNRENGVRGKGGYRCGVRLCALAGQPAEDAALGHLKAGCDGGYSGQRGWQAGHVCLHVAQQLLQLVQNWGPGHRERRARERRKERDGARKRDEESDGQIKSEKESQRTQMSKNQRRKLQRKTEKKSDSAGGEGSVRSKGSETRS